MERLNTLREKLDILLRNYRSMKRELTQAKAALIDKEEEVDFLRSELALREADIQALQIGKSIPDAESRAHARKQLDAVIGEIDKILMTLHD